MRLYKGKPIIKLHESLSILQIVQLFIAEFLGTALLLFVGCSGCNDGMYGAEQSIMHKAFNFGMTVMAAIQMFGHISKGHINPVITVTALVLGDFPLSWFPIYLVAQMLGATSGFGLIMAISPREYIKSEDATLGLCSPFVSSEISIVQAFIAEFACTFILSYFTCTIWDPRWAIKGDSVPIKFGLIVSTLAAVFGPYTGTHMNPARSFGPALLNGDWKYHWLFWVAPLLAAFVATAFYRVLFGIDNTKDAELPSDN